jgi:putative Mg2+ transporter-C (MgtC) family protein
MIQTSGDLMLPPHAVWELALRLGVAAIVGALIGLNRELRDKPAGVRTHALVALGSALLMLVTVSLTVADGRPDANAVSRTVQGIVTGIGFLGGGVILRDAAQEKVSGLTTAATIWMTSALGIVCAMGFWRLVLVAVVLTFAILLLGGPIESGARRLMPGSRAAHAARTEGDRE